jgi:hypothetical protein
MSIVVLLEMLTFARHIRKFYFVLWNRTFIAVFQKLAVAPSPQSSLIYFPKNHFNTPASLRWALPFILKGKAVPQHTMEVH